MPLIADLFAQRFEPLEWTITDGLLWLGGALIAWPTAYYSVMAIYNIYFHPLRNYPGPKSWVATPFWYTMLQLRGSCPRDTTEVHKKYGPVVRISANELSFTYPGAWRDIFGHKGAGKPEFEKDERYFSAYKEPTIINSDRQYHSFLRKKLNNGFSDSALRQQEPLIQDFLNTLMSGLHENSQNGKAALDMTMWYNYFTFDVIGYLTYGETFDCLKASSISAWVDAFFSSVVMIAQTQSAARLPKILRAPLMYLASTPEMTRKYRIQDEILVQKVNARLANPPPIPDFMGKLIEVFNNKMMSFYQLKQNSHLLIGAGSETTATALAGITYLLMTHPVQYDKLASEIRSHFSSAEDITMTSVNTCRYLLAVIEEGLRIYPPSSSQHSRNVPAGGATLDGHYVPEGMLVGITTYAILHSGLNFANPDKFAPERWLPEGERPAEYDGDKKEAFQAFSYGPRNCIGKNLAYAEMKIVLARLLWEFDLEYCGPRDDDWLDQRVMIIWVKKPLMVKLHPRKKA